LQHPPPHPLPLAARTTARPPLSSSQRTHARASSLAWYTTRPAYVACVLLACGADPTTSTPLPPTPFTVPGLPSLSVPAPRGPGAGGPCNRECGPRSGPESTDRLCIGRSAHHRRGRQRRGGHPECHATGGGAAGASDAPGRQAARRGAGTGCRRVCAATHGLGAPAGQQVAFRHATATSHQTAHQATQRRAVPCHATPHLGP
jgi:hypothetical protein